MAGRAGEGTSDAAAEAIATVAIVDYFVCSSRAIEATKAAVFDSVSAAPTVLSRHASFGACRYGHEFERNAEPCTIWDASYKRDPETAALINGV